VAFIRGLAWHLFQAEFFCKTAHAVLFLEIDSSNLGHGAMGRSQRSRRVIPGFNDMNSVRESTLPTMRLHEVINERGKAYRSNVCYNLICRDYTKGTFIARTRIVKQLASLKTDMRNCFEEAATSTKYKLQVNAETEYRGGYLLEN
jgi:hypothetical protein